MDSSPKNENSAINYSPSCLSKLVRLSLVIFLVKLEGFLSLHWQSVQPPLWRFKKFLKRL